MDYFYKELKMKNHRKTPAIFVAKRCSVFVFASLFSLTSVVSFAQADTTSVAVTPSYLKESSNEITEVNNNQSMINLNNSSAEQLATLKGVGQKRAQAIVTYRKQHGAFKSVNDLIQVKGIGEKVLSDNMARLNI